MVSTRRLFYSVVIVLQALSVACGSSDCNYASAQQMFNLAGVSLDGCAQRLSSLAHIFGDGTSNSEWREHQLIANRFLTANLVFTGRVIHVLGKSTASAFSVVVRPACYLKGRPPAGDVTLTGFTPSIETGLCLALRIEAGDYGMFFATSMTGSDRPTAEQTGIAINENGFIAEGRRLVTAWQVLQCRQNEAEVKPAPAGDASDRNRSCNPSRTESLADCLVSLATAREALRRRFVEYEPDLKSECQLGQDAVLRRLIKKPVEFDLNNCPAANIIGGDFLLLSLMAVTCSTLIIGF